MPGLRGVAHRRQRAVSHARRVRYLSIPTCTYHLQEVEPDVEGEAKVATKAQKKRKSKADVEAEGCGEPSTEPGPKRSRRIWDPSWDPSWDPAHLWDPTWDPAQLFIVDGLIVGDAAIGPPRPSASSLLHLIP